MIVERKKRNEQNMVTRRSQSRKKSRHSRSQYMTKRRQRSRKSQSRKSRKSRKSQTWQNNRRRSRVNSRSGGRRKPSSGSYSSYSYHGRTPAWLSDYVSHKIPILMREGYPHKQAIAIAYSMGRKAGPPKRK